MLINIIIINIYDFKNLLILTNEKSNVNEEIPSVEIKPMVKVKKEKKVDDNISVSSNDNIKENKKKNQISYLSKL